MSEVTYDNYQGETVMSGVTHDKCLYCDAKGKERIFDARSFSLTEDSPIIHP